jgi:hypothetical protein
MLFTHGEDVATTVCAADRAGMVRGSWTAALRADDEVRN